jgi:hypothetical protein
MHIKQETIENFPDGRTEDNVKLGIFIADSHGVNKRALMASQFTFRDPTES